MRILFVTTTFTRFSGDSSGGIGNCFYDLYFELSKYAKVDVVAPLNVRSPKYEKIGNLRIYREPPIKPYGSLESMIKTVQVIKIPMLLINMCRRIRSLSRLNKYDVIHGFFIFPAGLLVSTLSGRGIKIISALGSDMHTLSYKPFISYLYRFIFNNTEGVIYNAPFMKKRLIQLEAKNLKYIPTPINRNTFRLSSVFPKAPRFVFVGRLTKAKGVEILLESFKKVLSILPKAKLAIIGEGPEKSKMLEFIQKNKLQKSIQLVGALSSFEISRMLGNSYALLLPSFKEGTPASVLEAMSVGRPIVATSVGGLKDLVDKDIGYLTDIGNVDQFADAIVAVYKTHYVPNKIHEKTQKFDSSIIAKQYFHYYKRILQKKHLN